MFAFPLVAYAISGSALIAAWVESMHLLGLAAALLPAGVVVDRVNRKALMLATSASGVVMYASLAIAGILGILTIGHLVVAALLTGAASGVFSPAQSSAIRSVVATDELPTALSQNQAREHVAGLIGAPLGGALFAITRWLPFAVDAVTYAVSCVTLSRIRASLAPVPRTGPPRTMRSELGEGLRFIGSQPFFRVMLTWAALANLVGNALFFVVLLRMIQAGVHPAQIGLVDTAAGIGGILGALAAPYIIDKLRTGQLTVLIAWAVIPPILPLIWWGGPLAVAICVFVMLILNPAGNAGISAYRIAITPDELQGRVSAASLFVAMSVMPLSPLLGGWLLEAYGASRAIGVLLLATAALALLLTLSRSIREIPRPSEWSAPTAA